MRVCAAESKVVDAPDARAEPLGHLPHGFARGETREHFGG
jgi:hypothetical protein